jgi:IS30 family transposase
MCTVSRELRCDTGCRVYLPRQACAFACKRSESSRNASTLAPWVKEQSNTLLQLQWRPEQIAGKLHLSHETLHLRVYVDKAHGGTLWNNPRCQRKKRKIYASGRDRRVQIPNRRPLSERLAHIVGASKWVIGNATRSLVLTTCKPSSRWWSARADMRTWQWFQTKLLTWWERHSFTRSSPFNPSEKKFKANTTLWTGKWP